MAKTRAARVPRQVRSSEPVVVQPKLRVGAADDQYEREADRVAAEVVDRLSASSESVRRSGTGALAGSFDAPAEVESAIQQRRGGGQPLAADVRHRFEGAMGVGLDHVRIHHDAQADQLNHDIAAKAFTAGNDVYFSKGSYQPESAAGQRLLAHELTHTVQQSDSAQRTIRRMSVHNTDFSQTDRVDVFPGGSSGKVAKFTDASGSSIVLKVGQDFGNEMVIAAAMHTDMAQKRVDKKGAKMGGAQVNAPDARMAAPHEIPEIIKVATAKVVGNPRDFITGLASGQVLISQTMGGQQVKEVLEGEASTALGGGAVKSGTMIDKLMSPKGPLLSLSHAAATDVVLGMADRLISLFNPENFLFDAASGDFNFVDNVKDRDGANIVQKNTQQAGQKYSQPSFASWTAEPFVLAARKGTLATTIVERVFDDASGVGTYLTGVGADKKAQNQDKNAKLKQMRGIIAAQKPKLVKTANTGLSKGLSDAKSLLKNPVPLVRGVPDPATKLEAVTSLIARRNFLFGKMDATKAWAKAGVEAQRALPTAAQQPQQPTAVAAAKAPPRPTSPLPAAPSMAVPTGGMPPLPATPTTTKWQSAAPPSLAVPKGGMPPLPATPTAPTTKWQSAAPPSLAIPKGGMPPLPAPPHRKRKK